MRADGKRPDSADPLESATAGLRRITDLLLRVAGEDAGLSRVGEELDAIADILESHCEPGFLHRDADPVAGRYNALAPPLDVKVADGHATATGPLGLAYQGPRSLVHGGISALLIGHLLRASSSAADTEWAMAELSVRYHRPLPLFENVCISCRRTGADRHRMEAEGEIRVSGVAVVSASAKFVTWPHLSAEPAM